MFKYGNTDWNVSTIIALVLSQKGSRDIDLVMNWQWSDGTFLVLWNDFLQQAAASKYASLKCVQWFDKLIQFGMEQQTWRANSGSLTSTLTSLWNNTQKINNLNKQFDSLKRIRLGDSVVLFRRLSWYFAPPRRFALWSFLHRELIVWPVTAMHLPTYLPRVINFCFGLRLAKQQN